MRSSYSNKKSLLKFGILIAMLSFILAACGSELSGSGGVGLGYSACRLAAPTNTELSLGFPLNPNRLTSTGQVRAVVLFVDFPDSVAQHPTEDVFEYAAFPAVSFFKKVSHLKFDLVLEPHFEWLRMSKNSTEYTTNSFSSHLAYIQEAVDLADDKVDFTGIEEVIVITNPLTQAISNGLAWRGGPAWPGIETAEGVIYNGVNSGYDVETFGYLWLTHEMGHSLGLPDLYDYTPQRYEYVGDFSMMGWINGFAPEFFAYERWLLGWLDDDQIICLEEGSLATELTAIELRGGTKAIIIPLNETEIVVIEYRAALGYDNKLPKKGAVVYKVDVSIPTGNGPIIVYPNDGSDRQDAPLGEGQIFQIEENKSITIKVGTFVPRDPPPNMPTPALQSSVLIEVHVNLNE